MVDFATTSWVSDPADLSTVAIALDTKISSIDNAKVLRLVNIKREQGAGGDSWKAVMIYDA